jgi:SAM-dependent methyltransferase
MNLRERWEAHANQWIEWARAPGHDSYWRYHRDQFLQIVPSPGRRTIDIGCGEGRLTRHLKELGHDVVGIDASPSLVTAARAADPLMDIRLADAGALPLDDASADLAIAFMSLHDIDLMPAAVREVARVLEPGGRLCVAIVHPINSAGRFETNETADARFIIAGDYLGTFNYSDTVERDGKSNDTPQPALAAGELFSGSAGGRLLVEALREPKIPDHAIVLQRSRRWQRLPLFLHLRARRP